MNRKPYLKATVTAFAMLSIQALALPNGLAFPQPNHRSNSVIAQNSEEQTRIRVAQKARPAVVYINTGEFTGSGFIVNPNGLVITNAHVLEDAPRTITVVLDNNKRLPADVIGFAKNGLDLAAIKIRNQSNLPTLSLAKSVKVGQSVYAIGSPFGYENPNNFT